MKNLFYAFFLTLAFAGAAQAASQVPDPVRLAVQAQIDEAMAPRPDDDPEDVPDPAPPHKAPR